MRRDEPEASVVVVAEEDEGSDDEGGGAAPPLTAAGKPAASASAATAAATKQEQQQQQFRPPSSSPPPPPPSRPQIPAALRVPPERLQAALAGPLAPTAATISAVASDARLVALLDDAELMASVSRVSRDAGLFERELQVLARKGKAGDLIELYRRMAAVAARRCEEAFCGEEKDKEKAEEKKKKKNDEGASPLFAGQGPMQHQQQRPKQQQQQQPRAGIEVLR